MNLYFKPKSNFGKLCIKSILLFFIFSWIFTMFILNGERGGSTFFSNLKLTTPYILSALSGIISFYFGLLSIFKNKEKSIFVFISMILGFIVLLWVLSEIVFPH